MQGQSVLPRADMTVEEMRGLLQAPGAREESFAKEHRWQLNI